MNRGEPHRAAPGRLAGAFEHGGLVARDEPAGRPPGASRRLAGAIHGGRHDPQWISRARARARRRAPRTAEQRRQGTHAGSNASPSPLGNPAGAFPPPARPLRCACGQSRSTVLAAPCHYKDKLRNGPEGRFSTSREIPPQLEGVAQA